MACYLNRCIVLAGIMQSKQMFYKTLRSIHTECLRTYKRMYAKKIQTYKNWRMPNNAQFAFINPKSTWKSAHMHQPLIYFYNRYIS